MSVISERPRGDVGFNSPGVLALSIWNEPHIPVGVSNYGRDKISQADVGCFVAMLHLRCRYLSHLVALGWS